MHVAGQLQDSGQHRNQKQNLSSWKRPSAPLAHSLHDPARSEWKLMLISALQSMYNDGIITRSILVVRQLKLMSRMRVRIAHLHHLALQMPDQVKLLEAEGEWRDKSVWEGSYRLVLCESLEPHDFKGFISTVSLENPYGDGWVAFKSEVDDLMWRSDFQATGAKGKFELAELLRARAPALQKYRLGEVYHMVELGVKEKVLAFKGNCLGPYDNVLGFVQPARKRLPTDQVLWEVCLPSNDTTDFVRTMDELEHILHSILRSTPRITLSCVRGLVQSVASKELCPKQLGFGKLKDVITDPFLAHAFLIEDEDRHLFISERAANENLAKLRTTETRGFPVLELSQFIL